MKPEPEAENISIYNLLGPPRDFNGRRVIITTVLLSGPPPSKQALKFSKSQGQLGHSKGDGNTGATAISTYASSISPFSPPPLPSGDDYSTYSTLGSQQAPRLFTSGRSGGQQQQMFKMPTGMGMGMGASPSGFDESSSVMSYEQEGDDEERALMEALDKDMQERIIIEQEARDREAVAREM